MPNEPINQSYPSLRRGDRVVVRCELDSCWYEAVVLQSDEEFVRLHYSDKSRGYDEWVDVASWNVKKISRAEREERKNILEKLGSELKDFNIVGFSEQEEQTQPEKTS